MLFIKYGIIPSDDVNLLEGWSYGKKITIPANQIDASLTDHPVMVALNNTNFNFTLAKNDGSDIRFTDKDLNLLKFEKVEYSNTTPFAKFNVLLPTVSDLTDTEFYMYYGNPNAYNASIEAWQDQTGKQLTYNGNVKLTPIPDAMKIATSTTGTDNCQFQKSNIITTGNTIVLEAKVKIESAGTHHAFDMAIFNGVKRYMLYVKNGSVICNGIGVSPTTHSISNLTGYHTYKLKMNSTTNCEFYFDETLIATTPYADIETYSQNILAFGDGSTVAGHGGSTLWGYVKYNLDYGTNPTAFVEWQPMSKPISQGWTLAGTDLATLITETYTGRMASFDGSGDYFSLPQSSDLQFGTTDFTFEDKIVINSLTASLSSLGKYADASNYFYPIFWEQATARLVFKCYTGGTARANYYCPFTPTAGVVYDIAFVRLGNTAYMFINGVPQTVTTITPFNGDVNFTSGMNIGSADAASYGLNGNKLGDRITKGHGRYNSNYTPPTHFEIDGSDVVFCTNFDTIYDQNYTMVQHMGDTLVDATGNGNNGTATGTTVVNTDYGKARNFNGSSDYIQLPAGAIPHSSSPITILSSFKATSLADNKTLIADIEGRTGEKGSLFQFISNKLRWWYSQSPIGALMGNTTLSINTDYISAISWNGLSGTIIKMLLNGVVDATQTAASANLYSQSTYPFNPRIGMVYGATSYYYSGLIYETRISNSQRSDTWIKAESLGLKNQLLTIEEI